METLWDHLKRISPPSCLTPWPCDPMSEKHSNTQWWLASWYRCFILRWNWTLAFGFRFLWMPNTLRDIPLTMGAGGQMNWWGVTQFWDLIWEGPLNSRFHYMEIKNHHHRGIIKYINDPPMGIPLKVTPLQQYLKITPWQEYLKITSPCNLSVTSERRSRE